MELDHKTILVTGSPGFIGAHLVMRLLEELHDGKVISLDNMNDYYDVRLKKYRLRRIEDLAGSRASSSHIFLCGDLQDKRFLEQLFADHRPDIVVHLAARAGVRDSLKHPDHFIYSNIVGFFNLLEVSRHFPVQHFVFASSSSVYGEQNQVPFSVGNSTDHPASLYAATKKSNELIAYTYAKLYGLCCTGLRFFTVYGPAGRPDMFYYSTALKLVRGETVRIFNCGEMLRDFTYIDDIVEGIVRVLKNPPSKGMHSAGDTAPAPCKIYNIGAGAPVKLMDFLEILQEEMTDLGLIAPGYDFEAHREYLDMQPGDVRVTYADVSAFKQDFGFQPKTDLRTGLHAFVQWFQSYYGEETG